MILKDCDFFERGALVLFLRRIALLVLIPRIATTIDFMSDSSPILMVIYDFIKLGDFALYSYIYRTVVVLKIPPSKTARPSAL